MIYLILKIFKLEGKHLRFVHKIKQHLFALLIIRAFFVLCPLIHLPGTLFEKENIKHFLSVCNWL